MDPDIKKKLINNIINNDTIITVIYSLLIWQTERGKRGAENEKKTLP